MQRVSWSENALKSFLIFYCQIFPPVHLRCLKLNLFHGVKRAFIAVPVWKGGINCQYVVWGIFLSKEFNGRACWEADGWLVYLTHSRLHNDQPTCVRKKDRPSHVLLNDSSDNRTRLQPSAFSLSVTQAYNFKWMQHKLQHDSATQIYAIQIYLNAGELKEQLEFRTLSLLVECGMYNEKNYITQTF